MSNELKKRRAVQKGRLTKIEKEFEELKRDPASVSATYLDLQLQSVRDVFIKYSEVQNAILDAGEAEEPDEAEVTELVNFEERTRKTMAEIKVFKDSLQAQPNGGQGSSTSGSGSGGSGNNMDVFTSIKLPEIPLPNFSGDAFEWLSFRDVFTVNIRDHPKLQPVQKFQYLKGALSGEASSLIDNLPVTTANYEVAWKLLTDRYEDKKFIRTSILHQLFDQPTIQQESATELCKFLDGTKRCLRSLEQLREGEAWREDLLNAALLYLLTPKLDNKTRREWEFHILDEDSPTVEALFKFVQQRVSVLRNLPQATTNSKPGTSKSAQQPKGQPQKPKGPIKCPCCGGSTPLFKCPNYLAMSVADRRKLVSSKLLCFNCLRSDHRSVNCTSSNCRTCSQKHHTTLHQDSPQVVATTLVPQPTQVLLGTAMVFVEDAKGNLQRVRALIDNCAQNNLISQTCLRRLGLLSTPTSATVEGVNGTSVGVSSAATQLKVISCTDPSFSSEVKATVLPKVTSKLPQQPVLASKWPHIKGLELADPSFNKSSEVDLILGVKVYNQVMGSSRRDGPPGTPTAKESKLGWILSGEAPVQFEVNSALALCTLEDQVRRFWELEEMHQVQHLTKDQQAAEDIFAATTTRNSEGRYVVDLPFKSNIPNLGDSRQAAFRRLVSVERQLAKDEVKRQQYHDFMKEYIQLGHMVPVPAAKGPAYFLPHHAVVRAESSTTKLRVVFDASAASNNGRSLNAELLTGPSIQDDIFNLLVRFRKHLIVFTADVEKMFRQIQVSPKHRQFQRILLRFNPQDPVQEYELTTVTYGTSSAPFLATRCLHQLAIDEGPNYPAAAEVLRSDVYMDDVLSGNSSLESAKSTVNQLQGLLKSGGFSLRKWSSNSAELLSTIPAELHESSASLCFEEDPKAKTLGIRWAPKEDQFFFKVQPPPEVTSKRQLLSDVAKVYDPLGWLAPVTVSAKIQLQQLWLQNLSWDQKLPADVLQKWTQYRRGLMDVVEVRVPRCLVSSGSSTFELHGFSDASESAYAAAVYLRSIGTEIKSTLIAAKTRVAPLKTISLPKLELCGAKLLAELMSEVRKALKIEVEAVRFWSDSTITLAWIQCQPSTLKCFVANRVSAIQQLSSPSAWGHVEGSNNPADCASRGIPASELVSHPLWWKGPTFLSSAEATPNVAVKVPDDLPERRPTKIFTTTFEEVPLLSKFSSLSRLQRVTAYVLRFKFNALAKSNKVFRRSGSLSSTELDESLSVIVRLTQNQHFRDEIRCFSSGSELPSRSVLKNFSPFIDSSGVIRVGGRLRRSNLSYNEKHPVVLPKSSPLTTLVIRHYHLGHLHAGPQLTEAAIRRKFWIIRGRDAVRHFIHRCVYCHRRSTEGLEVKMADLPTSRVNPSPPFTYCGVDYAGPYSIKSKTGRGSTTTKGYICLFVCFATRGIHVELVSDLSSISFISAFKRFISVRGRPAEMYSDCGTNFKGADRELRDFLKSDYYRQHFPDRLSQDGIQWNFNPPGAPHMGGLWEAGVKSIKTHLKAILGEASLTYEELLTCLKQAEGCVNSRPISPMSSNPDDLQPLTPGHFLIGRPITALPERDFTTTKVNRLTRWELVQQLVQHFWNRWSTEYLSRLQQRPKWWKMGATAHVGDLVLLKDRTSPCHWKLARISATHPGDDGIVRVVTVKTATSELQRPVTSISLLPLSNDNDEL